MDHRWHLGWTTSILDADADDAGEEDDGNETTKQEPGGGVWRFGGWLLGFCLTLLSAGRGGCRGPENQRLVLQLSSFGFTSRMFMLFFSANSSKCDVVLLPFSDGIVGSLLEEMGMAW